MREMSKMSELQHTSAGDFPDLLHTKLALPRPRPALVTREALFTLLDSSLEQLLTLLSAPAGFGKTTLVRAWIAARHHQQEQFKFAWLSLDTNDNDPIRFLHYMVAAFQRFDDTTGRAALDQISASQSFSPGSRPQRPSFEAILTILINDLSKIQEPCILVLDDYHFITSPQIHETMAFLLDHLPSMIHIMLLSRVDPPFLTARLRAYGDILELRANELHFSLQETRLFLQQAIPFPLSDKTIARLHERTEGWQAGLNLVAFALRGHTPPQQQENFIETLTGSYRPLLEYLVGDVLNAQPEPLQNFLLQTSGLKSLTPSLCESVTGREDSDLLLAELEHANLFLESLDGVGQWYRYHPLFAEAMQHEARQRLGEEAFSVCFLRASSWYEQQNKLMNAIEMALLAQDFTRAATLIERFDTSLYAVKTRDFYLLKCWLDQFPQVFLQSHPTLCFFYAGVLMFDPNGRILTDTEQFERVEVLLHLAEERWQLDGNTTGIGNIYAMRALLTAWQMKLSQAGTFARRALTYLPEGEVIWSSACLAIIGTEERFFGSLDVALPTIQKSLALVQSTNNIYGIRATRLGLGEVYIDQGKLRQAAENYHQVLVEAGEDIFDRGKALLSLALISYEQNMLSSAEQQAQEALLAGQTLGDEQMQVQAALVLARVLCAHGCTEQALEQVEQLVSRTQDHAFSFLHREVLLWQARFQLAQLDFPAVQRWIDHRNMTDETLPFFLHMREDLLVTRFLLAQSKEEAARQLLEQYLVRAYRHAYTGSVIEISVLLALSHFRRRTLDVARQVLQEVLPQVRSENYQRLFLDEGQPMAALLRTLVPSNKQQQTSADDTYLFQILSAFEHELQEQPPIARLAQSSLVESLSLQEQRVLRLFVAGLSNRRSRANWLSLRIRLKRISSVSTAN